jgi:hypothetical protein
MTEDEEKREEGKGLGSLFGSGLQYVPICVFVRMDRTRASRLDGLEEGVIPLQPSTTTYKIKLDVGGAPWFGR